MRASPVSDRRRASGTTATVLPAPPGLSRYAGRIVVLLSMLAVDLLWPQKLLIPMDESQRDHLKAYGVTFWTLRRGTDVEWLLNYRGGSFLVDAQPAIRKECQVRGVTSEPVDAAQLGAIYATIGEHNMDIVKEADYVIDLGPEGGAGGGHVVASGPPAEILKYTKTSYTARWLAEYLRV